MNLKPQFLLKSSYNIAPIPPTNLEQQEREFAHNLTDLITFYYENKSLIAAHGASAHVYIKENYSLTNS